MRFLNYVRDEVCLLLRKSYGLAGTFINTRPTFETFFFIYDCHVIDFNRLDGAYFCARSTCSTFAFFDFCCHVITLS